MDFSANSWISEMGLEDIFLNDQLGEVMDFLDEDVSATLGEDMHNSWSQEFNDSASTFLPRNNSTTSFDASSSILETPHDVQNIAPSPIILTFGNSTAPSGVLTASRNSYVNLEEAAKKAQTTKKTSRTRPPSQTYDHIIAERKRREQLSQQFVALSAIVPGLKKMDKTSVLGDAINYLKQLQEKVKTLEEKTSQQTMESLVLVKKTQLILEEDGSSSDDHEGLHDENPLPEIEAKLCDKKLLLRIICEKHKGLLVNLFSEIQKLNLAVINTNVTPFGDMALDVTIVAELDKDFNLTMKEVVTILQTALKLARKLE